MRSNSDESTGYRKKILFSLKMSVRQSRQAVRKEKNERIKHRANMDCDYIILHHVILARKKWIWLENRRIAYEYYIGICLCVSCSKDANISVTFKYCSWIASESLLASMISLKIFKSLPIFFRHIQKQFVVRKFILFWMRTRKNEVC